jgi:hypothetical protein
MAKVVDLDSACELVHDEYEKAASATGWATNPRSRVPWDQVPSSNKATMRHAIAALFDDLQVPYRDRRRDGEGLL